jgi:hypothetical protein
MKKTTARVAAGAALAVAMGGAAVLAAAVPAEAIETCGVHQSCLYSDENWKGTLFHSLNLEVDSFGSFNDQASSVSNFQAAAVTYCTDQWLGGQELYVESGHSYNSLGAFGFNDQLSSWGSVNR